MAHHPSYASRHHPPQSRGKRRHFPQAELTWLPTQTTLFGVKLPSPVLLAPVGVQGILHEDGELATARAAGRVGVPFIMSSLSTRSIEAVAKANGDGHRWYQLYWWALILYSTSGTLTAVRRPRSADVRLSILRRAKAARFTALVFTVDSFTIGWRPNDLDTAYFPLAAGAGMQVGTSDPVFMQHMGVPVRTDERPAFPLDIDAFRKRLAEGDEEAALTMMLCGGWLEETATGGFRTWEDLAFLRDNWDGPIVLKGVQTVEDAHAAMDARIDGIVVSNHGAFTFVRITERVI
jgi:lactate 2-monooxygenase